MTADTKALFWGSALLGFAPLLCFLFQITFPKSQLIIVFITAAFFFLLASLATSIVWTILDPVIGLGGPISVLVPAIVCQFLFRCGFVSLYHRVETAIETSIEKSEDEQLQSDANENSSGDDDLATAKLKLELNDYASGIAAGTGFGGMHAILLFGSLLASESSDLGVLFQDSCPHLPSLVTSALNCFIFFFLDIIWMLFTFYGVRRRLIFPRGGGTLQDIDASGRSFGGYFGNTRAGGNQALLVVLITHTLAAGITTFNYFKHGCIFSLSLLPVVLAGAAFLFWSGVSKIFIPVHHSNFRLSLPASMSYGSRANIEDDDEDEEGDPEPL